MSLIPENTVFTMRGYKGATQDVPIPLEDLEKEYCRLTKQPYPIPEMVFVRSWMFFRVCSLKAVSITQLFNIFPKLSVISQGIAARYARRQASSEQAYIHVAGFPIIGMLAKVVLEGEGVVFSPKSKL
jgi:hypothetical protein